MEAKLDNIKLSDIIISETNKMFRDEAELNEESLKELIDSVREKGVIQPVLLRYDKTSKKGSQKYILVAGERRYRSSMAVNIAIKTRDTIPAYIRDMTEEEAFELQVIENLERKDVHPLKEAHAYKYLVDKDPQLNTVAELALRFSKTEHYITTRLKLNDLIAEARKDFADGLMSLGHALVIARLTPADQEAVINRCTDTYRRGKESVKYYQTISELEEHINDDIICNLSSAAFKKDDATLIPKAGACTTCPKHSGANQLFADVKEKDRCFDRACFLAKRIKFMATQIPHILETEPDTAFLNHNRAKNTDPAVQQVLKDNKVKVLKYDVDYDTYSYNSNSRVKINGIYINGDEVGKRVVVFSTKQKSSDKTNPVQVDAKEAISRIKERTERAAELDNEKVYGKILEALEAHPTQKDVIKNDTYYTEAEDVFLIYILWDKLGYTLKEEVTAKLKLPEDDGDDSYPAKLFAKFKKLTAFEKLFITRKVMLHSYSANLPKADFAYFIREIAKGYKDIPIATFEAEQAEIRKTREARAEERIKALQPKPKSKAQEKVAATPAAPAKKKNSISKIAKGLSALLEQE